MKITRGATLGESQFFGLKSAFEQPHGRPKRRPAKAITWDIVEDAFGDGNADVGVLLGKFPFNLCQAAAV